ncbi:uncharacterized protein LOC124936775 [Impatiens glandulifera]|uniref:uncharacterized protein LOC124936775 n=1 Tax=Impatiens glandulifera TaxID=253017 RepID=UPI001FB0E8FD|nr:uncharacterized protein LOC124936775 [Impatiens glandulifera]
MDFNLQRLNEQSPLYNHPLSSVGMGYFAEQTLLRDGYHHLGLSNTRPLFGGYFPNPIDSSAAIQREIEKDRIREEIIAAEIVRRRMFDEEMRRELILESRHVNLNRASGLLTSSSMISNLRSSYFPSETRSLEENLTLPFEKRSEFPAVTRFEVLDSMQFQRSSEPRVSTVKILPLKASEEEAQSMDKPTVNLSGSKRKADTPVTSSEKMASKNELNYCSLCKVGATCKENLNEHLKGKKHKSNVLKLGQGEGKNFEIGFFPKTAVEKQEIKTDYCSSDKVKDLASHRVGKKTEVKKGLSRIYVPLQKKKNKKMILHKKGGKKHL